MAIPIPEGFVRSITTNVGRNSHSAAPCFVDFVTRQGVASLSDTLVWDDETLFMGICDMTYGERSVYLGLPPNSAVAIADALRTNARIISEMFRPIGVRLIPANGGDTIEVPGARNMRMVGNDLFITDADGNERRIDAGAFRLDWLRPQAQPRA